MRQRTDIIVKKISLYNTQLIYKMYIESGQQNVIC